MIVAVVRNDLMQVEVLIKNLVLLTVVVVVVDNIPHQNQNLMLEMVYPK